MFDRLAIAWAIYRSGTPENLRELTEYGNAGPIADAVIAALNDAMHKSGVSNRPLNAEALAAPAPSCAPGGDERLIADLNGIRGAFERIAEKHPNDQPAYKDGVRPWGTGDLRHAIETLAAAAAALSPQGLDAKEGGPKPCSNPSCTDSDPVVERVRRWEGDASPRRVECQCGAFGPEAATDADAIAAWNRPATPSQRLDAATVERCAQVCDALAQEKRVSIHPKDHPMSGGIVDGMLERAASAYECAATRIRALATEPHQHGGKA